MRKAVISICALVIVACIVGLTINAKSDYYDYDLSKYVTLGTYKGVIIYEDDVSVSDAEVEDEILLRVKKAGLAYTTPVKDRPVRDGDSVNIDYSGTLNGEDFLSSSAKSYNLIIGSGRLVDGFEDALIGAKSGEKLEFDIVFPEEYALNKDIAGKKVHFTVTVNSIYQIEYPELTNAVARKLFGGTITIDKYRRLVIYQLRLEKKKEAAWNIVLKDAVIHDYPRREVKRYIKELQKYYEELHDGSLMEVMAKYYQTSTDAFYTTAGEFAHDDVGAEMVCYTIAKAEGLKITEQEYIDGVAKYASENNSTPKEYQKRYGMRVIKKWLLIDKVYDFIATNAIVRQPSYSTD